MPERKDFTETVEIIRCKHCVFFDTAHEDSTRGTCTLHSDAESHLVEMYADDFCSYGELKPAGKDA